MVILMQLCTPADKGQLYYGFEHNTRSVKPTILHFQVRKMIPAGIVISLGYSLSSC